MKPPPTRRDALLNCSYAFLAALACAGLLSAAALVPAPPAVLPILVATCIGIPMTAALDLRPSIAVLRRSEPPPAVAAGPEALDSRAIRSLRRHLARLPETDHPLGF